MRHPVRCRLPAIPTFLSALLLFLCTQSALAEAILNRGNGAEPQSLDPQISTGVSSSHIQRDLFEGLVAEDQDAKVIPGTASAWTVSDDGKTYTFTLRDNARWTNGDPVTAADFVYTYRRAVDPATGTSYSFLLYPIENAEAIAAGEKQPDTLGVKALDEHTLEIRLVGSTPYFLQLLTHPVASPVHQKTVEQYGDQWTMPEHMVSNGPFKLTEWVPQGHITVVKSDSYWDKEAVKLDKVVFYPTSDLAAELKAFQAGELDYTYSVPKEQINYIRENLGEQLHILPYLSTYYYALNTTRPPFDNADLRRAFSLALNRKLVTERVTNAGEIPAFSFVTEGVDGYQPVYLDFKDKAYEERVAEAQALYEKAGYGADKPLTVELLYNTSEDHKRVGLAIAGTWKRVFPGLTVNLVNEEWKVYLESRKDKARTQIIRAGWVGDYNDANTFLELWKSNSGLNNTGFSSPAFDQALKQAGQENDPAKREALLQQAERELLDSNSILPIYYYVTAHLINPAFKGLNGNVMDHTPDKQVSRE
ncbi:MAG: peptide ABC transporter substrate-binding protein [Thiolinea sp.]